MTYIERVLPELEAIQPEGDASLKWKRFVSDGFPYVWHFHPQVELTLILRSHGQRFVGDSIEAYGPGDLSLLGANLPHTWHTPDPTPGGAESALVQFREDFAGAGFLATPEACRITDLLRRARRGLHFPTDLTANDDVAHDLLGLEQRDRLGKMLGLIAVLDRLAVRDDARPLSQPNHTLPPRQDDQQRIDRVCRFLAEHYTEPIDQTDVADSVHLSPASFSRFFKRMTGRTFVAYLHELRIADACRRLAAPECRVTDACYACGFGNLSNFNRVFLRLRGTNPSAWRAQARDLPGSAAAPARL